MDQTTIDHLLAISTLIDASAGVDAIAEELIGLHDVASHRRFDPSPGVAGRPDRPARLVERQDGGSGQPRRDQSECS